MYTVNKIQEGFVNGKSDHPSWRAANELSDFSYPWENQISPLTSFQAMHGENWIYFFFQVKDDNIQVLVKSNQKSEVVSSDRVEIFFRKSEEMSPYYCLEIDPHGRVFDYEANHYRQFNYGWSWPAGQLIVKSSIADDGYTVKLGISKKSLEELGLLKGNRIEAGLFRANCTKITDDNSQIKWISWVKPESQTPDFHIPSAFGMLDLQV